ncbi:23S rRNA (guanosine(2251)-2'-O)-methyltransferase RlmB [Bacillota bacterium]
MNDIIFGRNPVIEALKGGREIEKLLLQKGGEGSVKVIEAMARDKKIPIQYLEKAALDRAIGGGAAVNHQGTVAYVSSFSYSDVDDLLKKAYAKGQEPFLIMLDGIEDPHNLGAIMRTADGAGAHGIIIPKRRAAGITETVAKASAGAVEYVAVAKVPNLAQTIDYLKDKGLWIVACDMGGDLYYNADLSMPLALVIGGEGSGVSRLILKKCDFVLTIPMAGSISSLNASNAAAILMYEICKQRKGK